MSACAPVHRPIRGAKRPTDSNAVIGLLFLRDALFRLTLTRNVVAYPGQPSLRGVGNMQTLLLHCIVGRPLNPGRSEGDTRTGVWTGRTRRRARSRRESPAEIADRPFARAGPHN